MAYYMALGARLRVLRHERELTLQRLGEQMGADPTTLCGYEKGNRCPSPDVLVALCDVYGLDVFDLLAEVALVHRRDHDPWSVQPPRTTARLDGLALFVGLPDRCLPTGPVCAEVAD